MTGGLGGVGLRVAGWLVEQGAGGVVLNGRRAPGEEASAAVEALRSAGADVRVEVADVTDGAAVSRMVSEIVAGGLPPLGGVLHAAGTWSDRALVNQDRESFARVLGPKVLGGWNLHRATLGLDLELFVVFSSLAGFLGNAGQANYAAANAWLEGLAGWRRSCGLAGQAIAWGAWSGVGGAEAARAEIGGRMEALGAGWLTPEQGLAALDRMVRADVAESAVAVLDWGRVSGGAPPLLEHFVADGGDAARAGGDGDLLERLRALEGAEREAALVHFLREEVGSALRLPAPPPVDRGFTELGADSLMAVELGNRLRRALGAEVSVPNTVVFDYPDIARLARYLGGQLGAPVETPVSRRREVMVAGGDRVAVVGMAGRFPGGADLGAFGERLFGGSDLVTRGRPDGLMVDGEGEEGPWGAYVADLDRFDAEFFGIARWRRS